MTPRPLYGSNSGSRHWLCACRTNWKHEWATKRCERCGRHRPLKRYVEGVQR